jgi:uncharacterized protein
MEEILSSIRRIIADEAAEEDGEQDAAGSPAQRRARDEHGRERDAGEDDEDVLELTQVVREEGEVIEIDRALAQPRPIEPEAVGESPDEAFDEIDSGEVDEMSLDGSSTDPGPAATAGVAAEQQADGPATAMDIRDDEMEDHQTAMQKNNGIESLVSERAAGAATGAFAKLSQAVQRTPPELAIADDSGRTVEQFVEDMMRPMLREWLEENLPSMVERIVQREIQKIVRRAEDG